jgi:glycosyltransferase involved in cell wall biosynthesis
VKIPNGLAVIETHPIQYHAPVYRMLQQQFAVPVTAIYASDFSVAGYRDREFATTFSWDTDLLSGYTPVFLSRVAEGGARALASVSVRGLWRVLCDVAPQVVLMVGYSPRFHQLAFAQVLRFGQPILFRGETTDHAQQRGVMKAWGRDQALQWLYQRCARLLYVGQRSYQHFTRLRCPSEKLLFSPYCVDCRPFRTDEGARSNDRPFLRRRLGIENSHYCLLFSGKLSLRKGPHILLQALRQLPPPLREQCVVVFVGSGAEHESLTQLAEATPAVRVHFVGFQTQQQLSPYYHAADLLVLPSLEAETWGLVVNEALHHGLPGVVSEAVGCAPDLIEPGKTGELCTTGVSADLAAAIQRALVFKDRPEVRERCRRQVSHYTVARAAAGIAQAYWAVVEHGGATQPKI